MNRKQIMLELANERSAIQITELKEEIEHLKSKIRIKNNKLEQIRTIANKLKTKQDYKSLEEVENDIKLILKECEE